MYNKSIRTSLMAMFVMYFCFAVFAADAATTSTSNKPKTTKPRTTSSTSRPSSATSNTHREAVEKEWTFMLFMAADNNLEAATSLDINELEKYGSTDQVNFVAQIDRNGKYSKDSELKWSGARRFYIKKDNSPKKMTSPAVETLGDIDMADPKTLTDFVKWAVTNYPAKKYCLILWNHGTGWKEINPDVMESDEFGEIGLPSGLEGVVNQKKQKQHAFNPQISFNISYDDTSKTSMNIPTLEKTLAKIVSITGKPLEIMAFDACLMQMAEVAWSTKEFAKCQIGSPDLEPERGWPYDKVAAAVTANPEYDGLELAKLVTDAYAKSYAGGAGAQGNTAVAISVVDHSQADDFKAALDNFCKTAIANISDVDKFEFARDGALKYSYGDYIDLGHFLALLIQKTHAKAPVKQAATRLLKVMCGEKGHNGYINRLAYNGDKFKQSRGLSIFFPTRQGLKTFQTRYKAHSFAKDTQWFNFLAEIANPNIPYLKLEDIIFEDKNKDGRISAGEEVTVKAKIKNIGKKSAESVMFGGYTNIKLIDNLKCEVTLKGMPAPGKSKTLTAYKFKVLDEAKAGAEVKMGFTLKGKDMPASRLRAGFAVKEQFASDGHVLLVYTDNQSSGAVVLEQMLKDAGIQYDTWDRFFDGDIRPEVLKRYSDGWVLICCQDSTPDQSLTDEEIDAIDQFLKIGGRVVLDGQDMAFCLRDHEFLRTRCKCRFVQDDVNVHVVSGIKVCGGHQFQIFGGDGANNQKWPDEIDPLSGAEAIFKYEEGARDMADEREMNGPNHKPGSFSRGVSSSGAAAVKVLDGYRLMLFGFAIESVNSKPQRSELMKYISGFMQPKSSDEVKNLARASARRPNLSRSVETSERVVVERADLLSNVEERLMNQIKEEYKADPNSGAKLLKSFSELSAEERKAVTDLEKKVRSLLDFDVQHGTLEE